jgi:hypothetical protein
LVARQWMASRDLVWGHRHFVQREVWPASSARRVVADFGRGGVLKRHSGTVLTLLLAAGAAKVLGKNLEIRRRGTTMVFWETTELPKTRAKSSGAGRSNGQRR